VILFVLGLAIYSYPWIGYDFSQQRIPGVLQRIALAFLAASAALLWLGPRARLALTGALLFGYWAVMSWVPVPGIGAGVLEPGQDLGSYIDRAVFGTNHLWASSRTWDPEGLLSTLPAVATVLLGIFAGEWLRSQRMPARKVLGLAVAGVVGVVLGLLWNEVFPINKKLWTSSFVVFTAGMGAVGLALCYWLVDVKGYRRWTLPFLVLGMNAITAYFLAELMAIQLEITPVGGISLKEWIYQNAFATWLSPVNASLAYAIAFVFFWMVVMWGFYRKRIFIKV
jgi:predicted acyltransferase